MLNERKLTENELEQRQIVLKGLLKNKYALVSKYGKDAEKVMYGIATKKAKKRVEDMNKEKIKELIHQALQNEQGPATNVEPYHDQTTTVDTGFSGRADYGEEDKALGSEDELEMRGLEEDFSKEKSKTNWRDPDWYKDTFADFNKEQLKVVDDLIKKAKKQKGAMDRVAQMARSKTFKDRIQKIMDKGYKPDYRPDEGEQNIWTVKENTLKEFVGGELEKRSDDYFNKLVPGQGNADTIEGELLRAINKIIYRYYNDGDYFYKGYGAETAGPAVAFLMNSREIPFKIQQTLTSILNKSIDTPDEGYERLLNLALKTVLDHIDSKDGNYTESKEDMLTYDSEYEDETNDYDEYDEYEDDEYEEVYENSKQIREKLNLNPEVSRLVNAFIRKMADRYDYSLQDAVYTIIRVMRDHNYKGLTAPGKLPTGIDRVQEKLTKKSSLKKHIDDFEDSDAPQFQGKSADKKRKMAVAAFLSKRND